MSLDALDFTALFDRIAAGNATQADLKVLRAIAVKGDDNTVQIGGRNINIGEGRDIHIGDHVYGGQSADLIRDVLSHVVRGVPRWGVVLIGIGFALCVTGLGIFFFGLIREMGRPLEAGFSEGPDEMAKFAAAGFGTFFVGFVLVAAGWIRTASAGVRAVARRFR